MTSKPTSTRSAGRPSAKVLTIERIVSTAQKLLKKHGEFTMSSLAKELKVAPSSLYNHVKSRDEVLAHLSDFVVKEISTTSLEQATQSLRRERISNTAASILWMQATSDWAHSYLEAFTAMPETIPHLAITPVRQAPQTLAMYERVVTSFVAFGFTPGKALSTIEALEAFLLGAALDANAPSDIFDPSVPSNEHPMMLAAYQELSASSQTGAKIAFASGLRALLANFCANVSVDPPLPSISKNLELI